MTLCDNDKDEQMTPGKGRFEINRYWMDEGNVKDGISSTYQ